MDQRVWHMISNEIAIYFSLMIREVTKRIKNLGKGQMWQPGWNIFWTATRPPQFNDCAHGRAGARNDWLTRQNCFIGHDVSGNQLSNCHARSCTHLPQGIIKSSAFGASFSVLLSYKIHEGTISGMFRYI